MSILKLKKISSNSSTESFKKGLTGQDSTISVLNSFSTLEGFSDKGLQAVKEALTYDNQEAILLQQQLKIQIGMAYRFKNFKKVEWLKRRLEEVSGQIEICWLKGNKFPTGHLSIVKDVLNENKISFKIKDLRKNNAERVGLEWINPSPELRHYQKTMIELAKKEHRGVFEAAVGAGKSLVMQHLTAEFDVPTLVVVPSKNLRVQTYNSFSHFFGKHAVEEIDGAKSLKSEKPIKICTIHSLVALKKKKVLTSFLEGIGIICIDEVHHAGARSYTELLPFFDHIYYRFGFSGTFMRNDSKTLDMWGFLSTVLYKYSAAQAIKEGFLTPLKIIVHEIDGIRGSNYQKEYSKNYCENIELLSKIKSILNTHVLNKSQVLILVGRKEKSGKIIHEYLNELGYSNEYVDGDSDGVLVDKAINNFNQKKTQILIGSQVIGEGIDVRSTDHLIMAQGGKSEIAMTQAVGRAVRLYPEKEEAYIHDFRFLYTKYLEKHLGHRLEIYKKNFDGEIYA